jgi:hypothetical protein
VLRKQQPPAGLEHPPRFCERRGRIAERGAAKETNECLVRVAGVFPENTRAPHLRGGWLPARGSVFFRRVHRDELVPLGDQSEARARRPSSGLLPRG